MQGHLNLTKRKRLPNVELSEYASALQGSKTSREENFANGSSQISLQTGLCIVSCLRSHIVSRIGYRETGQQHGIINVCVRAGSALKRIECIHALC